MSSQSKKVESIRVLIENRLNNGTEPANFSPDLLTNNQLFNFGKGFSEAPLLPNATGPIYATHISHNNSNYLLSLAPSAGHSSPGPIEAGPPVPLQGGKKVDIQQWTIMANPKF